MVRLDVAVVMSLVLAGCGDDAMQPPAGCDPVRESCTYEHDYGIRTVVAGEETDGLCQSWTLNNPTELWVNTVELSNDGAYHHSNWFFVPDNNFELPDGAWNCSDHNFDELTAAILGGVLFAQSTQSTLEVQQFPAGAAVRVPPYSRVIGSTHLLNVSDEPVDTDLAMKITTIPTESVNVKLAPFRLTYYDLHIPAMGTAEFTSTCDIKSYYEDMFQEPFALKLYYALPHYHQLASSFSLQVAGGPADGEVLLTNDGWGSDTFGRAFDPPIDVTAGIGFTFTCGFDNPTAAEVGWGIGDQEMCVMLGFAESKMAFDASVGDGAGAVTGMRDMTVLNSGPCSVLGFPYYQDNPGGG